MSPETLAKLRSRAEKTSNPFTSGKVLLQLLDEREALLGELKAILPVAVERMDWLHGEWPDILRDSNNVILRLAAMDAIAKAGA